MQPFILNTTTSKFITEICNSFFYNYYYKIHIFNYNNQILLQSKWYLINWPVSKTVI